MIQYSARQLLEREYGSQMFFAEGSIKFSPPVAALKRTLLSGDSGEYWKASALMLAAEMEYQAARCSGRRCIGCLI